MSVGKRQVLVKGGYFFEPNQRALRSFIIASYLAFSEERLAVLSAFEHNTMFSWLINL
jgi:hypothetical protein